ncbi:MAG: LytTR family transcriptional regulator [Hyphomicrobiales bacterium]|nr:LytTR family transcriptional regulator [Hyphomicrobiales bacterium]
MLGLPLAFAAPLVLTALAVLPAIWYLLRLTPPRPREVSFPPLRLILDLQGREETPARTPWWLLVLRLLLAALIILAMAGPIWNPAPQGEGGRGPLLVLLDDGWPAAPGWTQRMATVTQRIAAATREGRSTALVAMSDGGREILPADATRANERLRTLKPVPHVPDRMAVLPALTRFLSTEKAVEIVWIADGLASGRADEFADGLARAAGDTRVHVVTQERLPVAIAGAENAAGALEVQLTRADARGASSGLVRALDMKGLSVGETRFDSGAARETKARLELPIELRNEIARVEIADEHSAGAVSLLDERWKRRRVGLASGVTADTAQPLLSPTYYLRRALAPFADVREQPTGRGDPILSLLDDRVSVMVLADIGVVSGAAHDRLARFVEDGGVLLRFAGTRLAGASDNLVPVRLRRGGRVLGGSLSWDSPKPLAPFPAESPLNGLQIPPEVTITRQVLAEPDASLPGKTWAQLADGTPLVTAERRGKGLIVLVHVTADTTWSNLPLSGLFVDLLRRVVAMAGDAGVPDAGMGAEAAAPSRVETVAPTRTLDGFGTLGAPPLTARPIPVNFAGPPTAEFPPGFYGPADALTAVNTLNPSDRLEPAHFDESRFTMESLRTAEPVDLRPAIVAAAFLMLLVDALASLWLSGGFDRLWPPRNRRRATVAGLVVLFALGSSLVAPRHAQAQVTPGDAALRTHLAYVVTGDAQADEASRLGLGAVSRTLANRTALSPGDPVGVDPARDELAFYPLIYWPIVATRPQPSADAVTRLASFMKQGGTVVFDTRDAMTSRPGGAPTPEAQWLRVLLTGVDVPELEPVPRDHVVTKTFYLIDQFVGRTTVGQTWIEALPVDTGDQANRPARAGDSVSPIIITSNDLAAAWAADRNGDPLYPLVPGGHRQREMALRGGVNLVMYTLTGNYKADQVHVRDLLERLAH